MKKITLPFMLRVLCGIALFSILPVSGVLRGADVTYLPEMPSITSGTNVFSSTDIAQLPKPLATATWSVTGQAALLEQKLLQQQGLTRIRHHFLYDEEVLATLDELNNKDGDVWKQNAAKQKLDAATVASLEKHKLAFGSSAKQSFSPYMGGVLSVFVTSDSLLNAFHVLFEDSFRESELRRAHALKEELEMLLQMARHFHINDSDIFPTERYAAAVRHAQLVLGPAIVVLGGELEQFDETLRPEIAAQAKKIRSAQAVELPAWLAPADEASLVALDYRRCKPVGFYSDNEELAAYFRAVRWLQMVPFRGARVVEFDAIMLLGFVEKDADLEHVFQRSTNFVGAPDDPSAADLATILERSYPRFMAGEFGPYDCTSDRTKATVAEALVAAGYYQINSDLRARPATGDVFANCSFRVMPASRLEEAVLFQRLINKEISPRGLVVAAMLGSAFASERLTEAERAEVAAFNVSLQNQDAASAQVYQKYLYALKALFEPLPLEAPAFVKGEMWNAKNCQTSLAGWAQMRHAFTLQAKENEFYWGISMSPSGFVEPNPEFFARMARLVDAIVANLEEDDFSSPSGSKAAKEMLAKISKLGELQAQLDDIDTMQDCVERQIAEGWTHLALKILITDASARAAILGSDSQVSKTVLNDYINKLKAGMIAYEHDEGSAHDAAQFRQRWNSLQVMVRTLEVMARKQLRQEPWSEDEAKFLKAYGEKLAYIMGYFKNSYEVPRDDAPRWAEVSRDPQHDTALAVAVGRPRYLYVLYPWNGMEILCQGAVMQYYEYDAAGAPLTDAEWLKLLDSPDAPPIPDWLRPYSDAPGKLDGKH